jgi:hypothetical protein
MTKMYKVAYGSPYPVEVEAEIPSYPNRDSAGDTIYINTHFLDLGEAWKKHLAEHRAGLSLDSDRVVQLRSELLQQEHRLVETAIVYNAALRAYEKFLEGA